MSWQHERAAEELSQRVIARLNVHNRDLLRCPREKSYMTPCVARDGALAVADGGLCVGCGSNPIELLESEKEAHP
jgi:hypothetical protein